MLRTDTDNATLLVLHRQPTGSRTGGPPVAWVILRHITEDYQYFVQKPPPPIKSRRRRRYDERLAHLTARGGCVKKRRRLGPHLAPPYRRRPLCTEYGLSHALGACLGGRRLFFGVSFSIIAPVFR